MIGIFLDIETNGLDPFKHRSIEIAIKLIELASLEVLDSYESVIYQPPYVWESSDAKSLTVNGFTWQKVLEGNGEAFVAREIIAFFDKHQLIRGRSLFICQNPSFDRTFFTQIIGMPVQEERRWPYHWLDLASMYFILRQEQITTTTFPPYKDGLSKDEIATALHLPKEQQPHKAMNGVDHLILCYTTLLQKSIFAK